MVEVESPDKARLFRTPVSIYVQPMQRERTPLAIVDAIEDVVKLLHLVQS